MSGCHPLSIGESLIVIKIFHIRDAFGPGVSPRTDMHSPGRSDASRIPIPIYSPYNLNFHNFGNIIGDEFSCIP